MCGAKSFVFYMCECAPVGRFGDGEYWVGVCELCADERLVKVGSRYQFSVGCFCVL